MGRGGHRPALNAAKAVYDCRELAGKLFDAQPEQVVFTMNATHGLNIAIESLVPPGSPVVISGFEHNAVTRPLHHLGAQITLAGSRLFSWGNMLTELDDGLRKNPTAVICTHVSNVFGYILPIEEIAARCRQRKIPLIIDASQSAGTIPLSLHQTGASFIAMPGHKGLYGPQGTGILLCAEGAEPILFGGTGSNSQEQSMPDFLPDRLEAGTHNVCGIAGLAEGLRYVSRRGEKAILRREQGLLRLLEARWRGIERLHPYFGDNQSGVVSFTVEGMDCHEAAEQLGSCGVAVRSGLHCAPYAHGTAGTLETGTVRVSFSDFNTADEVVRFSNLCKKIFR